MRNGCGAMLWKAHGKAILLSSSKQTDQQVSQLNALFPLRCVYAHFKYLKTSSLVL